uniref:F-box/LRR-repeat protein 15-like leucin rich repeat domain-containing protein n=1 Tax=Rhizochromulina marina TaxID=1034831 RepID=A0A7S2R4V0_9STRA|mmetsp:Transcript_10859/g.31102  ORF Transcript_10859/g.31102 Transcript_10859/m.31102 type:complete len:551 (+) Transcript_10859:709-2361(+)
MRLSDAGILELGGLPHLRHARFAGCRLSWVALQGLRGSPCIVSLDLTNCLSMGDEAMAQVAHLSSLQSLLVAGCEAITDRGLYHIARLENLETLSIERCPRVTDHGLVAIAALVPLLVSFRVGWCPKLTSTGFQHIHKVVSLLPAKRGGRSLESPCRAEESPICVASALDGLHDDSGPFLGDELELPPSGFLVPYRSLSRLPSPSSPYRLGGLPRTTALDVSHCRMLGDEGLRVLAQVFPMLRDLQISGCREVTNPGCAHLVAFSQLQSLAMSHLPKVSVLPELPKGLAYLDASFTKVESVAELAPPLPGRYPTPSYPKALQGLRLEACPVSDTGIQPLTQIPTLTQLDLSDTLVRDQGFERLCRSLPDLAQLSIFYCNISVAALSGLSRLRHLRQLNIDNRDLNDASLRPLRNLSQLQVLDLFSAYNVTDEGLASLLPQLVHLESLILCNSRMTHRSLRLLEGLPRLRRLNISHSPFLPADGLGRTVERIRMLRDLDLSGCQATSSELLCHLPNLHQLQVLSIVDCPSVSDAAVRELRARMPRLRTIRR